METLIPGEYIETDLPERYTYTGGSTTGGAVIYDNGTFLYSHHATDPCGGKLVNAFDLVRLHKFGVLDDDVKPDTPVNRTPSFAAMNEFAIGLKEVTTLLNVERYEKVTAAFGELEDNNEDVLEWMGLLAASPTTGKPAKTRDNILIILKHDPRIKGRIVFDEFSNRLLALGALPWDDRKVRRQWTDIDDAGMQWYIEGTQGITGRDKIIETIGQYAFEHRINDVQDYLNSLPVWDGVARLETLLSDYLGAEDTAYTRQVARKSLVAAVARAMTPGVKYDYMPILVGPQGIGKSTLIRILGRDWYSDSLKTFEGKEACEMIQGVWLNELGELNGLTRSETNAVKQFLSQQDDIYREPYGRRTNLYPRRCVFFGTTNDAEFLRDATGERRFWPVDVGICKPRKPLFTQLEIEVDQVWAEAFSYWRSGEFLDLEGDARELWQEAVKEHKISNPKEGLILDFLSRAVPADWQSRSLRQRMMYWADEHRPGEIATLVPRDRVCAIEIWCECFKLDVAKMRQADTREINNILLSLEGWKRVSTTQRQGPYGTQRGYIRVNT